MFCLVGHITSFQILPVTITWDTADHAHPEIVWCLEVIGSYITLGLVLVEKRQTAFKRIGYFECSSEDGHGLMQKWFNQVEPKTISIESADRLEKVAIFK